MSGGTGRPRDEELAISWRAENPDSEATVVPPWHLPSVPWFFLLSWMVWEERWREDLSATEKSVGSATEKSVGSAHGWKNLVKYQGSWYLEGDVNRSTRGRPKSDVIDGTDLSWETIPPPEWSSLLNQTSCTFIEPLLCSVFIDARFFSDHVWSLTAHCEVLMLWTPPTLCLFSMFWVKWSRVRWIALKL